MGREFVPRDPNKEFDDQGLRKILWLTWASLRRGSFWCLRRPDLRWRRAVLEVPECSMNGGRVHYSRGQNTWFYVPLGKGKRLKQKQTVLFRLRKRKPANRGSSIEWKNALKIRVHEQTTVSPAALHGPVPEILQVLNDFLIQRSKTLFGRRTRKTSAAGKTVINVGTSSTKRRKRGFFPGCFTNLSQTFLFPHDREGGNMAERGRMFVLGRKGTPLFSTSHGKEYVSEGATGRGEKLTDRE